MKLTAKNYHQENGRYLTSSKISAYRLDPYYYYQKHVLKTLDDEKTDALILGSAVDTYVTKGKRAFNKLFKPVARRTNAEGLKYTEMTTAAYQEAVAISERVMSTTAFKELQDFERQVVLTMEQPLTPVSALPSSLVVKPLAGMLDFLKVKGNIAGIVDLKTARTADERKYFYHALDYGYFIQAAVYIKLVKANYPEVTIVDFCHLVVSKENKNFYEVRTFRFHTDLIENYIHQVNTLIFEISTRTDWAPKDASFKDAFILGGVTADTSTEAWETETV
jgi:hypothetical protein